MSRRILVASVATAICGLVFLVGSLLGAAFNGNGSEAAEPTTCTFCPGSGGAGQIGEPASIDMPSGGAGGSVAP